MKKILTALILMMCLLALAACGSKNAPASDVPGDSAPTATVDKPETDDGNTLAVGNTFTVCNVDYFSPCTSSEYLSFVIYNPNTEVPLGVPDNEVQPDTIVATIPIGKNDLWNGNFLYAYDQAGADNAGAYFHGIGGQNWFVPRMETYVQFYGWLSTEKFVYLYVPTGAQQNIDKLDQPLQEISRANCPAIICPELMNEGMSANAYPGEFVTGEGWGYFIPEGQTLTTVSSVYLPLRDGTDGSICYAKMFLNEEIPYDSASLTNAVKKGDFSDVCSYSAVADMERLDEVTKSLGNAPKLSETIFYQDLIATYISRNYGLNVRDKNSFGAVDRNGITYRERGENGLIDVIFEPFISDNPDAIKAACPDSFSYTDKDGTQYSYYFAEPEGQGEAYIFCNDVVRCRVTVSCGYANVTAKDILSAMFGIRP